MTDLNPQQLARIERAMHIETARFQTRARAVLVAQQKKWGKVWTDPYMAGMENMGRDIILVTERGAVYSLRRPVDDGFLRWVALYPETTMQG